MTGVREKTSEIVFDIETLPAPAETLSEAERVSLGAPECDDESEILRRMRFSPLTAHVAAIAVVNPETRRGKIWYEHPGGVPWRTGDGLMAAIPASEEAMLGEFWRAVARFRRIVTFNGRLFDCPFLMLRSALLGVPPSRNLMPYRYSAGEHCDLLDQLSFYGATRKFTLESYCRGFGIPFPETSGGKPGAEVEAAGGRYADIALYAGDTVRATAELYRRWKEFLSPEVPRILPRKPLPAFTDLEIDH